MYIKDVISAIEKTRPGLSPLAEECIEKLNILEEDIYCNLVSLCEDAPEYKELSDCEDELMVPDMYAELYIFYLMADIDRINGDITRYSNNMMLYNSLMSEYCNWYRRNHKPLQKGRIGWQ